ncbi:hypothetical protein ACJJTC_002306 [Scirpophaga incertulas]
MILKLSFFVTFLYVTQSEYVSYNEQKVYKVLPSSKKHVDVLNDMRNQNEYMFWIDQSVIGRDDRIMVRPEKQQKFEKSMHDAGINFEVVIDDVQKAISNQMTRSKTRNSIMNYAFDEYLTLDEIYEWMARISSEHPNTSSIVTIGQTAEGRDIKGIVIDFVKMKFSSVGVIEGGLHAREWISPATCMWIIEKFLTSTDPGIRAIADDVQWHIFPVTNPDGYVYTFTHNRMWRKNRNPLNFTSCAHLNLDDDSSVGVDLNRNFGYKWMHIGGSQNPCDQIFSGPSAFSEEESRALSNYIYTLIENKHTMLYYISFHSFSELLLIPYSDVDGANVLEIEHYADLFEIGICAMDKLEEKYGTSFDVGTAKEVLYQVTGTGFDWAKAYGKFPISYLFELRDRGYYGFLLPPEMIIPNNEEVMDALVEIHRKVKSMGYYQYSPLPSKANGLLTNGVIVLPAVLYSLYAYLI